MARATKHSHVWGIIAHNNEPQVLLGCRVYQCIVTEVVRPHRTKKDKSEFYDGISNYPHLCCGGDDSQLPSRPVEEQAA